MEWDIVLLEKCIDDQGAMREQYYYDTLKPWYNTHRPGQSQSEYRKTEGFKIYNKEYYRQYRLKQKATFGSQDICTVSDTQLSHA